MNFECAILLFHGVANFEKNSLDNPITNYNNKHISIERFEEYISYITENKNVISINDFVDIHFSRKEPISNSCVVTFDDGFKNNYVNAAPILEKYNCPAVFYISTSVVGSNKNFWVDQLEIAFSETNRKSFKLSNFLRIDYEDKKNIDKNFVNFYDHEFDLKYKNLRIYLLDELKKYLKQVDKIKRNLIIENVINYLLDGDSKELSRWDEYKTMSWDNIRSLSSNSLFEIGGHSSNHDILSKFSLTDLEEEIDQSINKIKLETGYFSGHYAYPEGQEEHYSQLVIETLKKKGVICCPSAIEGRSNFADDLFHLKRIMVDFHNENSISKLVN